MRSTLPGLGFSPDSMIGYFLLNGQRIGFSGVGIRSTP